MAKDWHDFKEKLKDGQEWELFLDNFFSKYYKIEHSTDDEQKQEIDRWFYVENEENPLNIDSKSAIEYKADFRMGETRNVFLETKSVDLYGVDGWVYSSKSDILILLDVVKQVIYVCDFETLRKKMNIWKTIWNTVKSRNNGYNTWGLIVPIQYFEDICITKFVL